MITNGKTKARYIQEDVGRKEKRHGQRRGKSHAIKSGVRKSKLKRLIKRKKLQVKMRSLASF